MKELEIFVKNIKNKEFLPIYFLSGEQELYIDKAIEMFETQILSPEERDFSQIIIYGKESSYAEVVLCAQQYPMMGNLQVVIVKEAQNLDLRNEESKVKIERYIENPNPNTILIFAHKHGSLNKSTKIYKCLNAKKYIFDFPSIKDYQLENWIKNYCEANNIKITLKVPLLLATYMGNNLKLITNELDKLKINLKNDEIIDEKMIETYVGISKEYNVFALTDALKNKNETLAYTIVNAMAKNPNENPMVVLIAQIFQFFNKTLLYHCLKNLNPQEIAKQLGVNPYFIKDYQEASRYFSLKDLTKIISIIRTADLESKGLGVKTFDYKAALTELCYKIIHSNEIK